MLFTTAVPSTTSTKMNSCPEGLETPLPSNSGITTREQRRVVILGVVSTVIVSAVAIAFVVALIVNVMETTLYKPEISLDSLTINQLVCPTNISNNRVLWDLKFGITNTNNYSLFCTGRFEVSIFPHYNQTKLLTKGSVTRLCLKARNHASSNLLIDASFYPEDFKGLLDPTSGGTIHLDLKINGEFFFINRAYGGTRYPKLVCEDAKVSLSPSTSSSWASMVGDPFACSYQWYGPTRLSFWEIFP